MVYPSGLTSFPKTNVLVQKAGGNVLGDFSYRLDVAYSSPIANNGSCYRQAKNSKSKRASQPSDRLPNVVIIFVDDLGYADIGPFGADSYPTPHLDAMAKRGRKFTDFVASSAVCSASRAALLTGCYHNRIGISGALGPRSKIGIHENEMTIAELCKQKNYATACFGKWHLGYQQKFLPRQHGFDHYFGLPYSNDMWPLHPNYADLPANSIKRKENYPDLPLFEGNEVVDAEVTGDDQKQLTTQYTERAVEFINENADSPFFLYVPHSMVHVPLFVSNKFAGRSGAGMFGDVMMEVDWSVGQIVSAITANGLEKNTLMIFTSDNGPWLSYGDHAGSAGSLTRRQGNHVRRRLSCSLPDAVDGPHPGRNNLSSSWPPRLTFCRPWQD